MKPRPLAIFACLVAAIAAPTPAQQPAKPLFGTDEPIRIAIRAPLSLLNDRDSRGSVSGTLIDPNGQSLPISLALRGITRRTSEICDFPPLRVDFTGAPPASSLFAGQNRLKLVTHCRNAGGFQQHVLLEYAAYRMLNRLSPRSFRVRLANIDYKDADGRPIISRIGYFIEPLGDVARRNGTTATHAGARIAVSELNPDDAARYALFQHMIGNHDWSMRAGPVGSECCHNAELIGPLGPGSVTPIPYDFDYSGLVNAPYATPPAELDIGDVKQRLYRGYCIHNAYALAAARQMRSARPQLLGVLSQVPGLDPRTQRNASAYLERFFADIATDAVLGAKVLNRCIG